MPKRIGRVSTTRPLIPAAGTLELQATLRNTLGFAEQLQISGEKGSKGSNEFSIGISKPRWAGSIVCSRLFVRLVCDPVSTSGGCACHAVLIQSVILLVIDFCSLMQAGSPGRGAADIGRAHQPAVPQLPRVLFHAADARRCGVPVHVSCDAHVQRRHAIRSQYPCCKTSANCSLEHVVTLSRIDLCRH